MIYTLTFNPALDYTIDIDNFRIGVINRTKNELLLPGGKGINVSIVLSNFGVKSKVLGFNGGFTGDELERLLSEYNIETDFTKVEGNTRINVKIKGGIETAINGLGPRIEEKDQQALINKISKLKFDDILIISGNVPQYLSKTYIKILEILHKNNVQFIADVAGQTLLDTLPFRPLMVKPNIEELEDVFNIGIRDRKTLESFADKLIEMGAENVIISLGNDGAVMKTDKGEFYEQKAPDGKVVNTVGAGDSLLAGFIKSFSESTDLKRALKYAVACGSASAFSENLATAKETEKIFSSMN